MNKERTPFVPFIKRRWTKIVITVLLLIGGFLIALPFIVQHSLVRWLVDHGAQSAVIDKININLFTGKAGIEGLHVKLADHVVLGNDKMTFDVALRSLFKKEGHLETGLLSGLLLDIVKEPDDSLRIGSITTTPSPDTSEQVNDSSWLFRADRIELADCDIRYTLPGLTHIIHIQHALLENIFTGTTDRPGHLELTGTVNGSPIRLKLNEIVFKPSLAVGGHISIKGYDLATLQELLKKSLQPFAGLVDLNGDIRFSLSETKTIGTKFHGDLSVTKAHIGNGSFATKSPILSYTGHINYSQGQTTDIQVELDGLLQGNDYALSLPSSGFNLLEKQVKLGGKTKIIIADDIVVDSNADLDFSQLNLDLSYMHIAHTGFHWQGKVQYLLAKKSGQQTIHTDGSFRFNKPMYASGDQGFALQSEAENVTWQGIVDLHLGSFEKANTIALNGSLQGNNYHLAIPDMLDFTETAIGIDGNTQITLGQNLHVQYRGQQQHDHIQIKAANTSSKGNMSWQGLINYRKQGADAELITDGTLKGSELNSTIKEQKITISQSQLDFLPEKLAVSIGKQIKINGKATLKGKNFDMDHAGLPLLQVKEFAVNALHGLNEKGILVDDVTIRTLRMPATKKQPVTVKIPKISLQHITSTDLSSAAIGSLLVQQPIARNTQSKTLLAGLDALAVHNITLNIPLKVTAASLSTGKGYFLKKEGKDSQPMVTMRSMRGKHLSWSGKKGFVCKNISVDSLLATLIRRQSSEENPAKQAPGTNKKKKSAPLPAVKINNIAFTGNSGFTFDDQTTSRPFFTRFVLDQAEINNIDLASPKKPFTFALKGTFDTYSPLDISGSGSPFADELLVDANIRLRNYALEKVSPYVIDTIGTKFIDGQLYLTADLAIKGDSLDIDNNVVCQEIKAQTVDQKAQATLTLPISLDMALSLLRDSNGDIDLDIPVSGKMSDFTVSKTDIIITAVSKAILVAVTPYLAYTALGPAGAVAYVGLKAGQEALDVGLPSITFADRATELTDAHKKTLKTIGRQIADNNKQDYSICSKAMIWELADTMDKTAENEQRIRQDKTMRKGLLALSRTRAENAYAFLMKHYTIDKDHLLICPPSINYEPTGKPVVKFRKSP